MLKARWSRTKRLFTLDTSACGRSGTCSPSGSCCCRVFGLGLVFWVLAYVRYKTTELAITTKRVIVKHGFIRRRTVEININKVESIQVDQEILGRMFNFGTLVIAGAGDPQAPIAGISSPMAFRKAFIEAQDQAKSGV